MDPKVASSILALDRLLSSSHFLVFVMPYPGFELAEFAESTLLERTKFIMYEAGGTTVSACDNRPNAVG